MAASYSIAEARAQLPSLVDRAALGAAITITRRGRPVAVLVAPGRASAADTTRSGFERAYQALLQRYDLREAGLEDGFAEGLRDRSPGRRVRE